MTVDEIISKSSNVGTITLAEQVGEARLSQWIKRFGFGAKTGIDFRRDAGDRSCTERWSGSTIGTLPIGHGIAVTPVQMAAAYATVANEGVWLRRTSWRRSARFSAPRTPLDASLPNVARQVMAMMRDVVVEGTGQEAALPGYQVAGKTGTAAKPDASGGYFEVGLRRVASWASFPRRTSYRRPRHDRRAARRDLGRHRRGSGLRRHRPLRASTSRFRPTRQRRSPLGSNYPLLGSPP